MHDAKTTVIAPPTAAGPIIQRPGPGRRPKQVATLKAARAKRAAAAAAEAWCTRKTQAAQQREGLVRAALDLIESQLRTPGPRMDCLYGAQDYLCLRLGALRYEMFAVLFLDSHLRLIACEEMFRGTLTQTAVYPREVLVAALGHNAAAVILAHNHPSGTTQPSLADMALTRTLAAALAHVDVKVVDHFIVAGGQALSLVATGRWNP